MNTGFQVCHILGMHPVKEEAMVKQQTQDQATA
jgi:hypothetical protein